MEIENKKGSSSTWEISSSWL